MFDRNPAEFVLVVGESVAETEIVGGVSRCCAVVSKKRCAIVCCWGGRKGGCRNCNTIKKTGGYRYQPYNARFSYHFDLFFDSGICLSLCECFDKHRHTYLPSDLSSVRNY